MKRMNSIFWSIALGITVSCNIAYTQGSDKKPIPLKKGPWELVSLKGNAQKILFEGTEVFTTVGNLNVEEIPEIASLTDSSMLLQTGKWLDEAYAIWEGRMDDGNFYAYHVDQVTHVGEGLTWTAHAYELPPTFFYPPHMNVEITLALYAFGTVMCGNTETSLKEIDGSGRELSLEETAVWKQYRLVLSGGAAGAIAIRTVGMEGKARITRKGDTYALLFRQDAPPPKRKITGARAKYYTATDMRVRRLSFLINPADKEESNLKARDNGVARLLRDQEKKLSSKSYPPEVRDDLPLPGPRKYASDAGIVIRYDQLKGARRNNRKDRRWDVAWWLMDKNFKDDRRPARTALAKDCGEYMDIEGVWRKDFEGDTCENKTVETTTNGSRRITVEELQRSPGKEFELPGLGILGDLAVFVSRDLASPIRFSDETGRVIQEQYLTSTDLSYAGGRPLETTWFEQKPGIKARRGAWPYPRTQRLHTRHTFLSSSRLDANNDGLWSSESGEIIRVMSYRFPLHMDWLMIVPATWIEVPVAAGNKLQFAYESKDGPKRASFALNPYYLPENGNVKIAFMTRQASIGWGQRYMGGVYVVQSGNGRGLIIGKIADSIHRDHLSIVPGTLKILPGGQWTPHDRIPHNKRKKFAEQGYLAGRSIRDSTLPEIRSEHSYYEERKIGGGWGYFVINVYGGSRGYGTACQDPFLDRYARPVRMKPRRSWFAAGMRYDMKMTGIYWYGLIDMYECPSAYIGEFFDPKTGKTYEAGVIDKTNSKAMEWCVEEYRRVLLPFRGSGIAFATSGEMGTKVYLGYDEPANPLWSRAALQSYRKFVGNPQAKLPAYDKNDKIPGWMTHDVPDETWKQYERWVKRVFVNPRLAMYKGAGQALGFGIDPWYKGGSFFAGTHHGYVACDLEAVASAPGFGIFVCEYPWEWDKETRLWYDLARKYGKEFYLLQMSTPSGGRKAHVTFGGCDTTQYGGVIDCFKRWGADPDSEGLIMCGNTTQKGELWQALAAKYFGKGPMSEAEASAVIKEIENKIALGILDKAKDPIHKAAKTPTIKKISGLRIDGDLTDWKGIEKQEFEHIWHNARYTKMNAKLAKLVDWTGPEDLSGHLMIGYDKEALYIAASIKDSVVINRERVMEFGENMKKGTWRTGGDAVNIDAWIIPDPRPSREKPPKKRNVFLMIPGWKWNQLGHEREWPQVKPTDGTQCITRLVPGGYVCEARLPWSVIGWKPPKSGQTMAFDIYVKDRDKEIGGQERIWRTFSTIGVKPWLFSSFLASGTFE